MPFKQSGNVLFVNNDVDEEMYVELCDFLNKKGQRVIYFQSNGGCPCTAYAIHDYIKHQKPNITIIGTGIVASAAMYIFLSVPFKKRFCTPLTTFLIHASYTETEGKQYNLKEEIQHKGVLQQISASIIMDNTSFTEKDIEDMERKEFYFYASDAEHYKVCNVLRNPL